MFTREATLYRVILTMPSNTSEKRLPLTLLTASLNEAVRNINVKMTHVCVCVLIYI